MPIVFPPETDAHRAELERHLGLILGGPGARHFLPTDQVGEVEEVDAEMPHEVFVVGRDDVAEGKLLEVARPVGWRYLVRAGDGPFAAAELHRGETGQREARFAGLNRGPLVDATMGALDVAARLDEVRQAPYEARLLKVPALQFAALWLHGRTEILVPLLRHDDGLTPLQPRTPEEVLAHLRPIAAARSDREGDHLI